MHASLETHIGNINSLACTRGEAKLFAVQNPISNAVVGYPLYCHYNFHKGHMFQALVVYEENFGSQKESYVLLLPFLGRKALQNFLLFTAAAAARKM